MIKEEKHIFWIWILAIVIIRLALFLPHRFVDEIRLINTWVQVLLFLMTVVIAGKSQGPKRYIYINFALYFGLILLLFAGIFISETIFNSHFGSFYYYFYINCLANAFFSLFLIIYILLDYSLRHTRVLIKYIASVLVTAAVLLLFFQPYLYRPLELYKQSEYVMFRDLQKPWTVLSHELGRAPRPDEMTTLIQSMPDISQEERASFLTNSGYWYQSLNSNNIASILWMPIRMILMYLNLLIIFAITTFLAILYWFDKPYHPYIDKLFILLIPLFALEAFHDYSYTQTISVDNYRMLFTAGQYATVAMFMALVYILHLSLHFSVSPAGIYYEEALTTSPVKVTRWRDEIDLYLLRTFINDYKLQQKTISFINK